MENSVVIKLELEVQAQRIISQHMLHNAEIAKEIEAGVRAAFESINMADEVEAAVKSAIRSAITQSSEWDKIREAVKTKCDEIVNAHIDKAVAKFKSDF